MLQRTVRVFLFIFTVCCHTVATLLAAPIFPDEWYQKLGYSWILVVCWYQVWTSWISATETVFGCCVMWPMMITCSVHIKVNCRVLCSQSDASANCASPVHDAVNDISVPFFRTKTDAQRSIWSSTEGIFHCTKTLQKFLASTVAFKMSFNQFDHMESLSDMFYYHDSISCSLWSHLH